MDEMTKTELLKQFNAYLEETELPQENNHTTPTDLFSLLSELVALRSEVKIEARQAKASLEQSKMVFDLLQANQESLAKELERHRLEQAHQSREMLRLLLLEFLEAYDRLAAGLTILNNYKPFVTSLGIGGVFCKQPRRLFQESLERQERFVNGIREGQAITLRRLEQTLSRYRVYPLEPLGKPLEPHSMRAIEIENRKDVENGIVTGEIRKGFIWENEVLRLAEVKVNKIESSLTSEV
ncbi:MAG: nucleotide exchange factor GrpE [Beggiatoa sp. IS2]|nr:MAG: nucleotide exchange factor GrpE [Beggiatoa sp. IS2]